MFLNIEVFLRVVSSVSITGCGGTCVSWPVDADVPDCIAGSNCWCSGSVR